MRLAVLLITPPERVAHASNALETNPTESEVTVNFSLTPILSLLAGILILVMPKLLNYIVAVYLIAIGLVGLLGSGALRLN